MSASFRLCGEEAALACDCHPSDTNPKVRQSTSYKSNFDPFVTFSFTERILELYCEDRPTCRRLSLKATFRRITSLIAFGSSSTRTSTI